MKRYQAILIILNILLILAFFHYSVNRKEDTLTNGKLILLELAPVDPRSLIQGDYMDLRYAITENGSDSTPQKGYYVVTLDSGMIARKQRLQTNARPLNTDEYLIRYHYTGWRHSLGAESFFFQEGQAEKFANAKYGAVRVDQKGNSILVGLYDENRQPIK